MGDNRKQHTASNFVLEMFGTIEYRKDSQGFKIRKPDMAQGFELHCKDTEHFSSCTTSLLTLHMITFFLSVLHLI